MTENEELFFSLSLPEKRIGRFFLFLLRLFSREATPVRMGDVVHLEGRPDGGSWLVDREQGFLVLLPDSLISGTSISSSIRCMRRAVLGDMFKV